MQDKADARRIVGLSLGNNVLPLFCAPVLSDGTAWGVLLVGRTRLADEELWHKLPLLEHLAELAGAFLENAALQASLRNREEQLCHLVKNTLRSQETEREHICFEVHDGVCQSLVSAFQYLQTLETDIPESISGRQLLFKARTLVKQAIQESREIINSLQPATLKDLGLIATLRQEMQQLEQETGWLVEFKADAIRLPVDVETGLYRIIHEAIVNVKKHAHTTRLRVAITYSLARLNIEVKDWGIGFDHNQRQVSGRRGIGLLSMCKRAELLQGTCNIQSERGEGTTVRVEIPVTPLMEVSKYGKDKGAFGRRPPRGARRSSHHVEHYL